jgi:hypothetical protein
MWTSRRLYANIEGFCRRPALHWQLVLSGSGSCGRVGRLPLLRHPLTNRGLCTTRTGPAARIRQYLVRYLRLNSSQCATPLASKQDGRQGLPEQGPLKPSSAAPRSSAPITPASSWPRPRPRRSGPLRQRLRRLATRRPYRKSGPTSPNSATSCTAQEPRDRRRPLRQVTAGSRMTRRRPDRSHTSSGATA